VLGSIHHILKDVGDVTLDMPVDELLPVDEMDPGVRGMALELSEAFYDTVDDDRGLPETGVRVLNICTMENGESSVYRRCNAALHERNREAVRPWAKYIAALLEALRRCPRYCGVLYRGMRAAWDAKMDKRYAEGKKVYFWGFTSATTKMEVLMSPQFLGPTGDRVLFIIQAQYTGVSLSGLSMVPSEEEVLLPPCSCFEVLSKFRDAHGLVIVQMKQITSALELLPESGGPGEDCDGFLTQIDSLKRTEDIANIVLGMTERVQDMKVQEAACSALLELAPCPAVDDWRCVRGTARQDAVLAQYEHWVALGVSAALLDAMRQHSGSATIAGTATSVLWVLARNDRNKVKIAAEGGIAVVIDAMKRHKDNGALQGIGCGALGNLARNSEN
jgi:hypothetical protein